MSRPRDWRLLANGKKLAKSSPVVMRGYAVASDALGIVPHFPYQRNDGRSRP